MLPYRQSVEVLFDLGFGDAKNISACYVDFRPLDRLLHCLHDIPSGPPSEVSLYLVTVQCKKPGFVRTAVPAGDPAGIAAPGFDKAVGDLPCAGSIAGVRTYVVGTGERFIVVLSLRKEQIR